MTPCFKVLSAPTAAVNTVLSEGFNHSKDMAEPVIRTRAPETGNPFHSQQLVRPCLLSFRGRKSRTRNTHLLFRGTILEYGRRHFSWNRFPKNGKLRTQAHDIVKNLSPSFV
ncbi:hypothetical protein C1I88_00205 [Akkermansia muciniphila]|nr:hypothetical protein C1I88_00205 [Akkermansia muciniphila]